jgi:hypothetical protein
MNTSTLIKPTKDSPWVFHAALLENDGPHPDQPPIAIVEAAQIAVRPFKSTPVIDFENTAPLVQIPIYQSWSEAMDFDRMVLHLEPRLKRFTRRALECEMRAPPLSELRARLKSELFFLVGEVEPGSRLKLTFSRITPTN